MPRGAGGRAGGAVLQGVQAFNADPAVHGLMVQLPMPKHINEEHILDAISLEKARRLRPPPPPRPALLWGRSAVRPSHSRPWVGLRAGFAQLLPA